MDTIKENAIPFLAGVVAGFVATIVTTKVIAKCRCDRSMCSGSRCPINKSTLNNSTQPSMDKPRQGVIFVLGGPGSGKGTYCARMVADRGFPHFSAGDLLRAERASGSELGNTINSYISKGALVPAWITV